MRLSKDQGGQKLATSLRTSPLPSLLLHAVPSGSAPASKHIFFPRPIHFRTPSSRIAEHITNGVIGSQGHEHCWRAQLCDHGFRAVRFLPSSQLRPHAVQIPLSFQVPRTYPSLCRLQPNAQCWGQQSCLWKAF